MTSGHNLVGLAYMNEYSHKYSNQFCDTCGVNILDHANENKKPAHRHCTRFGTKYRCDDCYERLYGGVTLWKNYPKERKELFG